MIILVVGSFIVIGSTTITMVTRSIVTVVRVALSRWCWVLLRRCLGKLKLCAIIVERRGITRGIVGPSMVKSLVVLGRTRVLLVPSLVVLGKGLVISQRVQKTEFGQLSNCSIANCGM